MLGPERARAWVYAVCVVATPAVSRGRRRFASSLLAARCWLLAAVSSLARALCL